MLWNQDPLRVSGLSIFGEAVAERQFLFVARVATALAKTSLPQRNFFETASSMEKMPCHVAGKPEPGTIQNGCLQLKVSS